METIFKKDGRPFFVLGGQSHNSSTYSPHDLAVFWRALDTLHANTAEIPVYWEAIEPEEGVFDFRSVDTLFEGARAHKKQLILLWFGTWKNGNMRYVPAWVKQNPQRFPRVIAHDGARLFVLSSHAEENLRADQKAFRALMAHLKEQNTDGTLLAVQVENEAGIAGRSYRDFSPEGWRDAEAPVPDEVLKALEKEPDHDLTRRWARRGYPKGENWEMTFGVKAGTEAMTAWSVARYIDQVAAAGKDVYDIPLYVNVALDGNPWGWNLPGVNYTAGGPIPRLYPLWKAATPHIDLLAPDIYQDSRARYEGVCRTYNRKDNALFVPESGSGAGGNFKNLFYALGAYDAIGYACFGAEDVLTVDGAVRPDSRDLVDSFTCVAAGLPLLTRFRGTGRIHPVVQEEGEDAFFFEGDKYLVKVDMADHNRGNYIHRGLTLGQPEKPRARGLIIEAGPEEFYVLGTGFTMLLAEKDDLFYSEDRVTNHMPYLCIEEGHFDEAGCFVTDRIRTGDECDHGVWVYKENGVVHVTLCP